MASLTWGRPGHLPDGGLDATCFVDILDAHENQDRVEKYLHQSTSCSAHPHLDTFRT
jgi:hypothetical protein